jgi:hypothetical protein
MTWRLGSIVLVMLVVAVAAASTAQAGVTRNRLWTAMHAYAACRDQAPTARFAGDISAADRVPTGGSRVTYETLMTNRAALIVNAGHQRHRVRWITSHGVVQHLGTFVHLRDVAGKLRRACR